jgi:hypothetical protein
VCKHPSKIAPAKLPFIPMASAPHPQRLGQAPLLVQRDLEAAGNGRLNACAVKLAVALRDVRVTHGQQRTSNLWDAEAAAAAAVASGGAAAASGRAAVQLQHSCCTCCCSVLGWLPSGHADTAERHMLHAAGKLVEHCGAVKCLAAAAKARR